MGKLTNKELALLEEEGEDSGTDSTGWASTSEEKQCDNCGADVPKNAKFCPECGHENKPRGTSCARKCCCCCCGSFLVLAVLIGLLIYFLDWEVQLAVEQLGGYMLGTNVTLKAVDINLASVSVDLEKLSVGSPNREGGEQWQDQIFKLDHFLFDVAPMSFLEAWWSDFEKPVILEAFRIVGLTVMIDMDAFPVGNSNAQDIIDNINEVISTDKEALQNVHDQHNFIPGPDQLAPPPIPKPTLDMGAKATFARVRTDRIELSNITAGVRISTLPEIIYTLDQILITDVGKEGNGVHLYELLELLVRAVLMGVIKGAPTSIRSNLANAFGKDLWHTIGFAVVHMDLGQGMQTVGEWAGWVAGESAQLNMRMTMEGAKLNAQALEMGVKINSEFLNTGVKLSGMAAEASMAATNAQVQATAQAAQMATDFTTGFTKGLTSITTAFR